MNGLQELQQVVARSLAVMLQLAAALGSLGQDDPQAVARSLTEVIQTAGGTRYADEALYWRARISEAQEGREAKTAAAKDYVELMRRLPDGRLRRTAHVRLAVLTEPGALLTPEEARAASRRNLVFIGRALHAYAADHGGRLPSRIDDLLDDYLSSPITLVRPGPAAEGGGKPYAYRAGLVAEIGVTKSEAGEDVPLAAGVPVVAWEAATDAAGGRLALRLDGEVMALRPKSGPEKDGAPQQED